MSFFNYTVEILKAQSLLADTLNSLPYEELGQEPQL